ncbi:MAG: hypothetical protein K1W33_07075 [Clostridia bacterium]
MTQDEKNRNNVNTNYEAETKKYVFFMCKKGCRFYNNGCTKNRTVRECAKKGLKNKE